MVHIFLKGYLSKSDRNYFEAYVQHFSHYAIRCYPETTENRLQAVTNQQKAVLVGVFRLWAPKFEKKKQITHLERTLVEFPGGSG